MVIMLFGLFYYRGTVRKKWFLSYCQQKLWNGPGQKQKNQKTVFANLSVFGRLFPVNQFHGGLCLSLSLSCYSPESPRKRIAMKMVPDPWHANDFTCRSQLIIALWVLPTPHLLANWFQGCWVSVCVYSLDSPPKQCVKYLTGSFVN